MKTAIEDLGINLTYPKIIKIIYNNPIMKRKEPESISHKIRDEARIPILASLYLI